MGARFETNGVGIYFSSEYDQKLSNSKTTNVENHFAEGHDLAEKSQQVSVSY